MLLREFFCEYTKEELMGIARTLDLKQYSRLRKSPLIYKITDYLCSEEIVRTRLACLTNEELSIFRKGCESPYEISKSELVDSLQLYNYWLGYFDEETDKFCVFEDIVTTFRKIDDVEFRNDQEKKGWLMKCIQFYSNYYGVGPIEKLYEIYALKEKDECYQMLEKLFEMPIDMTGCGILPMKAMGFDDWPKEDPLYSDVGLFVHISYMDEDECDYLLKQQIGKNFYVPSVRQIEELSVYGYEKSSLSYKNLDKFFINKLNMSDDLARVWCMKVWVNSYEGENPTDIVEMLYEENIMFDNDRHVKEFVELLMNAHNNTRMLVNRGHKPNEIIEKDLTYGMPTIVPGSTKAAEMLKEISPQLKEFGLPVDIHATERTINTINYPNGINGEAIQTKRKIYPNDPCICGSGKKYKKCCGRR